MRCVPVVCLCGWMLSSDLVWASRACWAPPVPPRCRLPRHHHHHRHHHVHSRCYPRRPALRDRASNSATLTATRGLMLSSALDRTRSTDRHSADMSYGRPPHVLSWSTLRSNALRTYVLTLRSNALPDYLKSPDISFDCFRQQLQILTIISPTQAHLRHCRCALEIHIRFDSMQKCRFFVVPWAYCLSLIVLFYVLTWF